MLWLYRRYWEKLLEFCVRVRVWICYKSLWIRFDEKRNLCIEYSDCKCWSRKYGNEGLDRGVED